MFKLLQRAFIPAVAFSIIFFADTVFADSKRASENQPDSLNTLVTVFAEYVLNHTDEVKTRLMK